MSDRTTGYKGSAIGSPLFLSYPLAASASVYAMAMVFVNASGYAIGTSATAGSFCAGVAERDVDNSTGSAGAASVNVFDLYWLDNDTTNPITLAMLGRTYCYAVNNYTVGSSDLGGSLIMAGVPVTINTTTGKVGVSFRKVIPDVMPPGFSDEQGTRFKARVVATSIGANTGTGTGTLTVTATGALGAQDGVTCVAGDVIFIQEGTTNVAAIDAGPWEIAVIGTTGVSAVLRRPDWWAHGAGVIQGAVIEVGSEGTGTNPSLAGTSWKCFAAKGKIVDTDAPVFWPRKITCAVTLASGTLASARTTMPIRSHLVTDFIITNDPATAAHASTRVWRVSALTAGVTGTASVQMVAESAPGTTNASDVGQYNLTAINW